MIGFSINEKITMKIQMPDVHTDAPLCPLSVLWLVNLCEGAVDIVFANELISALLNAEIPLYFVDEELDSNTAFVEYRLTNTENAEARLQATCSEFCESGKPIRDKCADYFASSVCSSNSLPSVSVPHWFEACVTVSFPSKVENFSSEPVRMASLFVKLMDVKLKCQLQGIAAFHWPDQYPYIRCDQSVAFKLENGLWVNVLSGRPTPPSRDSLCQGALLERRILCILKILRERDIILDSGVWNPVSGKSPRSSKIYEWVKNDPSFCNHGRSGRGSIAESTFKQLWKEQLRLLVLRRMGVEDVNW